MATIRAITNGNWSAASTWNGGVLPGNGDTVYSNGFTITIDQNVEIGAANNPSVAQGSLVAGQWYQITASGTTNWTSIGASSSAIGTIFLKNATAATGSGGIATALATITTAADTNSGATAGGVFTMTTAYTLNADIRAGTTTCLTLSGSGNTTIGAFNIVGSSSNGANAITNNSTGTITAFSANITAGGNATGGGGHGINNANIGNISVSSSTLIGGGTNAHAINNASTGGISVSLSNLASAPSGGNPGFAIGNSGAGSVSITSCVLTGGGSSATAYCIQNNVSGSISVSSSTLTGNSGVAINNVSSGAIICISCTFTASNSVSAIASTNANATNRFSGTFISSANGTQPINATRWILNSSPTASYIQHALDGINANSYVRYFTADTSLGQAAPTDVRSGVSYASGNLTGRLTIPARGTVASGVNLGPSMPFTATRSGTTATATLAYSYPYQVGDVITVTGASNSEWNMDYTITEVVSGTSVRWTVPATHSATAGTGANAQTKGTAVLDGSSVAAAVWGAATRTLTSASGPTAVEIRQEMDTNSTKLANLDATVSSRLSPSGTLARVTLVDVATTLTNAPTVPSAATIATQVRTELGTELARIDAPVSGATAPSASTVATAVRTELGTELGRIDAAISTRATPANIPASDITAIKAKTDALNTDRLAQVSTVSTTGAQLAAALS